jgi:acetolactate synthase-1/3 small subunit
VVEKLVKQIRKIIEVLAVFGYEEQDVIYNELAFYKIPCPDKKQKPKINTALKENDARILYANKRYFIIEKAGTEKEIHRFFKKLKPFGIMEFVRSGRISLAKNEKGLSTFLPRVKWEYNI